MSFHEIMDISIAGMSINTILSALLTLVIGIIIMKIINRVVENALSKSTKLEVWIKNFIHSGVKILLWVMIAFIVADSLGIPSATLVAALSVAGLALSLSLQNILTNVFSGFTVLFTHPFEAGDFVEIGAVSGTVLTIGIFYTSIMTVDNKAIHIPNADVASSKITNATRADTRRVDLTFGLGYDCAPEQVRSALLAAAAADPRVLADPAPAVLLSDYAASNIQYFLRAWVKTEDYWDVYFGLNESALSMLKDAGLSMAYDHVDVNIISGD